MIRREGRKIPVVWEPVHKYRDAVSVDLVGISGEGFVLGSSSVDSTGIQSPCEPHRFQFAKRWDGAGMGVRRLEWMEREDLRKKVESEREL